MTRRVVSALFLSGYVAVLLPVVLYTGGLAVRGMFGLELELWLVVVGIGILGSCYAIFGGLRAVAVVTPSMPSVSSWWRGRAPACPESSRGRFDLRRSVHSGAGKA